MNARRAPERVIVAHLTDERPQLYIDLRAPSPIPRLPAPIAAKPANQRLRTDDVERVQDRRKHAIELDEEPSVGVAQPNSVAALPLQDNHLLAEHRNLGVKARLRCERPDQDCENEPEKPDHPVSLRDSLCPSTERGFRYTQP